MAFRLVEKGGGKNIGPVAPGGATSLMADAGDSWDITSVHFTATTTATVGNRAFCITVSTIGGGTGIRTVWLPVTIPASKWVNATAFPGLTAALTYLTPADAHYSLGVFELPWAPIAMIGNGIDFAAVYEVNAIDALDTVSLGISFDRWRNVPTDPAHVLVDAPVHTVTP